jgi:uncharacterized RmlC-like cupin family protein
LVARLSSPWRQLVRRGVERVLANQGVESLGQTVRALPRGTPYDAWLARAKADMPVFEGLVIQDVRTEPLQPWAAMGAGVTGLYLRLSDYQMTDGYILELPPRAKTEPRRHMFETGIYFFEGPGHTILQQQGKPSQRVGWNYRSVYSIPLNVRYQHVNDSDAPIRLLAVTSFPFVMNAMNNEQVVFDNPLEFTDRFDAGDSRPREPAEIDQWLTATDFVADALTPDLAVDYARGEGNTNRGWQMSGNTMISLHVAEMPARTHKKAHRHSSDAFVLVLSGAGYSVVWPGGSYDRRVRIDWHEGTLFVPPTYWYHQHMNPGVGPARYLAMSARNLTKNLGLRFTDQLESDLPDIEDEWQRATSHRSAAVEIGSLPTGAGSSDPAST